MKNGSIAAPIALALALSLGGCSKEETANIEATSNEAAFLNDGALLNDDEAANLVDDETLANGASGNVAGPEGAAPGNEAVAANAL